MKDIQSILDLDYLSVTELMDLIEELDLEYTRQALGRLKRDERKLFQYDAIAFGSKFFRVEKVYDIIKHICKVKNSPRTAWEIDNAYNKIKRRNREER
jgi:hypothetical protein